MYPDDLKEAGRGVRRTLEEHIFLVLMAEGTSITVTVFGAVFIGLGQL